jgi:hypothetical protein
MNSWPFSAQAFIPVPVRGFRGLRHGTFEDVDTEDHRTPNVFLKFRMRGLFVRFAATAVHRLVTAVTVVAPVMHAPHVTASPVKS